MAIQSSLERDLRLIHAEGQGVWKLSVVTETSSPAIIDAALAGDAYAIRVACAAAQMIEQLHSRRSHAQCLLCDNPLQHEPAAIAVMTAYGAAARTMTSQAFCSACATDRSDPELGQAVIHKLRKAIMPDLRLIPTPSQPGHA